MNPFQVAVVNSGTRLDPALDINNGGASSDPWVHFKARGSRGKGDKRNKSRSVNPTGGSPYVGPVTRASLQKTKALGSLQATEKKAPKPTKPAAKVSKVHQGPKPPLQ